MERGAVVSIRLSGSRTRGVVAGDEAPPVGIKAAPVERVDEQLPAPLVELALWLADYYGSTPGRALGLVAPQKRERRKELPQPADRDALGGEARPAELTKTQLEALARLTELLEARGRFLLHGATGSGKTEVYLQAAEATLEQGRGVIVLVPEIALAPQTIGRFRARFGDRIAVLHSSLTEAERRDERERIASGAAPIVIGARSAILPRCPSRARLRRRGARLRVQAGVRPALRRADGGGKRASLEGAVALFGSATPRPESWAGLERLDLGERVGADLPVRVVDLRGEAGYRCRPRC